MTILSSRFSAWEIGLAAARATRVEKIWEVVKRMVMVVVPGADLDLCSINEEQCQGWEEDCMACWEWYLMMNTI